MGKFRLAVFNTQPPHLYFGGVERRIIETSNRLQTQADITVYSGTKAGFKKPANINGVSFVPCYSTDRLFPLDNWFFNRSLYKKAEQSTLMLRSACGKRVRAFKGFDKSRASKSRSYILFTVSSPTNMSRRL